MTSDPWDPKAGAPNTTFQVFGWSRGYVGFAITAGHDTGQLDSYGNAIYTAPTLQTSYSTDGVHWHAGQKLETTPGMNPLEVIRSVIEGPAGLLAVGWTGGCASEHLHSLWTSSDGKTWQAVDTKSSKALIADYSVTHLSGGAPGYVGVAYKSGGVWISKDGRNWQTVSLRAAPFANSLVDDGTAIDGGFVLAGTTGTADCGATVQEPGDATPKLVFRTASAWWSADGSSWTHIALPGAVSRSGGQSTWVSRLSDRRVLVVNDGQSWVSGDGKTWSAANLPYVTQGELISEGQHNLLVEGLGVDAGSGSWAPVTSGRLRIRTIDDQPALVAVDQTGDVPDLVYWDGGYGPYGMVAIGPTGVVVTSADGSQLWFGMPLAK